jgi:hypothetical protein
MVEIMGVIMFSLVNGKANTSSEMPADSQKEVNLNVKVNGHLLQEPVHRTVIIANPVIKTVGLILLYGALTALSAYSLVSPLIAAETARLIFLCGIALVLQSAENTQSFYTDRVVSTFLYA